ncbi:MAG TPA: hypothetical protein VHW95_14075 [Steroidobacteraceae bacterium]|jgi:hypothetical protein|nr:hypothetical protein [Steroidobacteraceae bacterium]
MVIIAESTATVAEARIAECCIHERLAKPLDFLNVEREILGRRRPLI